MSTKKRPKLSNLTKSRTLNIEKFQNEVIRPIIKMQHELLIVLFTKYIYQIKSDFNHINNEKKRDKINVILTKDNNLKNMLIGCIIGHLSNDEINYYLKHSSEFKKRILQIIKQRLQDNLQFF